MSSSPFLAAPLSDPNDVAGRGQWPKGEETFHESGPFHRVVSVAILSLLIGPRCIGPS